MKRDVNDRPTPLGQHCRSKGVRQRNNCRHIDPYLLTILLRGDRLEVSLVAEPCIIHQDIDAKPALRYRQRSLAACTP